MGLFNKLRNIFSKKEKQTDSLDLQDVQEFLIHRQKIEEMARDRYAIDAFKRYETSQEVIYRKYHVASPLERDGKQGFVYLCFEHIGQDMNPHSTSYDEISYPNFGRFIVKTDEGYSVERLEEAEVILLHEKFINLINQEPTKEI